MPEVAQPTPASKVCAFCGMDVANQQRVKDAQGRYACIPCANRAKEARAAQTAKPEPPPIQVQAAKAAAPSTADGVDPVLNELLAGSTAAKKVACGSCGYLVDPEAKICAHCGFDKDTGKAHRTVFIKAPKEKAEKLPGTGIADRVSPLVHALLVFGVLGGAAIGGAMAQQVLPCALGILLVMGYHLVMMVLVLIHGFREGLKYGVILVLGFFFGYGALYWPYYALLRQPSNHLRAGYGSSYAVMIAIVILQAMGMLAFLEAP